MSDTTHEDEFWREIAQAVGRADPLPPSLVQAARDSFTWRTVDEELAALTHDSLADQLATVRGVESARLLTFTSERGLAVEVEVTKLGAHRRLVGQLVPPQPARIEVARPQGGVGVDADPAGRFLVEDVPAGPVCLRCLVPGAAEPVVTDWIVI